MTNFMSSEAISVDRLSYAYGARQALDAVTIRVSTSEIFAFVGPNGSGKSTLFRILSTLISPQSGQVQIVGNDIVRQQSVVRRMIGVVFQSPSLDKKLTVAENIRFQAILYGLSGNELSGRLNDMMVRLGVMDRANDYAETLSGGLRRRVELAKGMIHRPHVLLLDEPSTGLDPAARSDLWKCLDQFRNDLGMTIVLTTHLLEEAERADRVAILAAGKLVALGTPRELTQSVGGDTITIEADHPDDLADRVSNRFGCPAKVVDKRVRLERPDGYSWVSRIVTEFPDDVRSIRVGKPTLEDVFIAKTGHKFWDSEG
jgi:ABC-2 type transport system ATP-binding protein